MFYSYFDPTMILLIPALIISFLAQSKVKSADNQYKKVRILIGHSGQ